MSKFGKRALALMMAFVMVLSNVSGVAQAAFAAELEETVPVTVETEPAAIVETTEIAVETTAAPAVEPTQEPVVETMEDGIEETTEPAAEETAEAAEATDEATEEVFLDEELISEAAVAATMTVLDTKVTGLLGEYAEASQKGTVNWSAVADSDSGTVTIAGSVVGLKRTVNNRVGYMAEESKLILASNLEGESVLTFNFEISTEKSSDKVTVDGYTFTEKTGYFEKTMNLGDSVVINLKVNQSSGTPNGASIILTDVRLGANPVIETEFLKAENGSYTISYDDTTQEITETTKFSNKATTNYSLVATPDEGYLFAGWWNATKSIYVAAGSTSNNVRFTEPSSLVPLFIKKEDAVYGVGDAGFTDFSAAVTQAKNAPDKVIVLLKDATLEAGEYKIPAGVTLLIPFDDAHTLYTDKPACTSSKNNNVAWVRPTPYRTMTMATGTEIIVEGTISVSAMHAAGYQQTAGSPTGPFGHIVMSDGAGITLDKGGKLYTWGYITGAGEIVAKSGSEVWENIQITDFRGGGASMTMVPTSADDPLLKEKKVFPFSQYYVQNIEVALTVYSGAKELVSSTIYALEDAYATPGIEFVGGSTAMFELGEGSYIVKDYDNATDRLNLSAYGTGDMKVNSLAVSMAGQTVNSSMFNLPITSNITINANGGNTTINQDVALMPGSQVNIAEGATLTMGYGYNVFVYDQDDWSKGFANVRDSETGEYIKVPVSNCNFVYLDMKVRPVSFSPAGKATRDASSLVDAKVDVNGTLRVEGDLYTTAGGANITSTKGTGQIWITSDELGTADHTNQVTQSGSDVTFVDIPITPAKLKNADGSFTATESIAPISVFAWTNGKWEGKNAFNVTFDGNRALGTMEPMKVTFNDIFFWEENTIVIPENGFVKPNGAFLEWNTKRDGTGESYQPGDLYTVTEDVTLYAIWDVETYKVIWIVDGEQYGEEEIYEVGAVINVPAPTKADDGCKKYTFSGWNPVVPETMPAENMTFTGTFVERIEHSGETVMAYNDVKTHKVTWSCCGTVEKEAEEHVPYCECGIVTVSAELTNAKLTNHTVLANGEKSVFFAEPGKDLVVKAENTAGTGVALFAAENSLRSFDGTLTIPAAKVTAKNDLHIVAKATVLVKINLADGEAAADFVKNAAENGIVIGDGFVTVPVFCDEAASVNFKSFSRAAHSLTGAVNASGEALEVKADETGARIILAPQEEDLEITLTWKCDTLTKVEATEANCTDTGNHEHWKCGCGKLYLDAEGTQETTLEDVTIPTNGEHDWALTGYEVSEESHISVFVCNHDERHTKRSAAEEHDFNNEEHKCVCGKLNKFTITFMDAENQQITTITAEYGSDISAAVSEIEENFAKENLGLLITRWEDEKGQEVSLDTMPGGDVTVHAVCVYQTFEITWVVEGEVWDTDIVYFMQEIEAPVPTKEAEGCTAYAFVGWDPEVPEHMPSRDVTFNAVFEPYTKHVSEEITYKNVTDTTHDEYHACCDTLIRTGAAHDYNNAAHRCGCGVYEQITVNVYWSEEITWSFERDYGTTTTIPVGPAHPGYNFIGFAKSEGGEVFLPCGENGGNPVYTYTESVDLYPVFTMNTFTYTVETWEMDTNGQYVKTKTEEKTADYGTVIDLTGTETPEYLYVNGEHADSKLTATVPANNDLVMKVYLARKVLTVKVIWDEKIAWELTPYYGSTSSIPTGTTPEGHTFLGFAKTAGGEVFLPANAEGDYTQTWTESMELHAVFAVNSYTYTVETWEMDTAGQYVKVKTEEKTADYGTVIDLTKTQTPEYLYVNGEHVDSKLYATVPANNDLVMKIFLARNALTVKVIWDEKTSWELKPYYGATSDIPTGTTPEGHTFLGFAKTAGGEVFLPAQAEGTYTYTWTESMDLYAVFAVNTYIVTFTMNGETFGEPVSVKYGESFTAPAYTVPVGHTFSGWTVPETMPAEDITLDATLTLNSYTLIIEAMEFSGDEDPANNVLELEVPYGAKLADYITSEIEGCVIYTTGDEIDVDGKMYKGTYFVYGWESWDEENGYQTIDLETITMPIGGITITQAFSYTGWNFAEEGTKYILDGFETSNTVAHIDGEAYLFGEDGCIVAGAGLYRHVAKGGTVEYYYFCDGVGCVNGCTEASYTAFRNTATSETDTDAAIHWVSKHNDLLPAWDYAFDARGVILHHEDTSLKGLHDEGEDTIYYIDGVPAYMGLIQEGESYYYVRSSGKIVKNASYWITKTNGLLEEGAYLFDENGVLIPEQLIVKDGIVEENGGLYYYVDGVLTYAGLIEINGEYYYVRSNGQLVQNQKYWVTKTNNLLPEDSYTFDAEGKIVFTLEQEQFTGIADGYYYVDGVKTYAGLIQIDGAYYYVNSSCQVITGRNYWITKTNGLMPEGIYTFDEEGKMVQTEQDTGLNGIVDGYYYVDGVKTYAGLIEIDGKYYYANSTGKIIMGRKYWITKTNGLMAEGAYEFDATGAMIMN